MLGTASLRAAWQGLLAVAVVANVARFLGYAAAVSWAAIFNLHGTDPREAADTAFHVSGALSLLGLFLWLLLAD